MNRIDRLTAILLRLQSGKRTAGELADHFEVSRRTILRDIQALSEMNIPVVAEVGVEGGYSLPDDYSLPLLALTLHEAILLRLALSSLAQLGTTPFERERTSLLDKAETLLPRHERARLAEFAETLAVDLPAQPHSTPFLDRLLESARREEWVTATYRSARGRSQQTLLPRQLRTSAGLWYCEAYAHEHGATRVYRVDRFLAVQPALSPPQAAPPPHFDPSYPEIRVRLTAPGMTQLDHHPRLLPYLTYEPNNTGLLVMHLRPEEYDWLVRLLLSAGAEATIIAPATLRERVQQAAAAIAQHHAER
jgi:predicted DNA-binding transcriptional regulator YafY